MKNLIEKYRLERHERAVRFREVEQKRHRTGHDPRFTLKERKEKIDELEWIQVAIESEIKVIDMFLEDLENL
jgi:hypothetical protein